MSILHGSNAATSTESTLSGGIYARGGLVNRWIYAGAPSAFKDRYAIQMRSFHAAAEFSAGRLHRKGPMSVYLDEPAYILRVMETRIAGIP